MEAEPAAPAEASLLYRISLVDGKAPVSAQREDLHCLEPGFVSLREALQVHCKMSLVWKLLCFQGGTYNCQLFLNWRFGSGFGI